MCKVNCVRWIVKDAMCKWVCWSDQLDGPAGQTSWMDQLDGPAERTSWTDQMDRPAGRISWRTSSIYLKPWPLRIFEHWPFSLYIVTASESDEGLVLYHLFNHIFRLLIPTILALKAIFENRQSLLELIPANTSMTCPYQLVWPGLCPSWRRQGTSQPRTWVWSS